MLLLVVFGAFSLHSPLSCFVVGIVGDALCFVGLLRIINERRRCALARHASTGTGLPPLLIIGPHSVRQFLETAAGAEYPPPSPFFQYSHCLDVNHGVRLSVLLEAEAASQSPSLTKLSSPCVHHRLVLRQAHPSANLLRFAGICSAVSVPVIHCRDAYGLVLDLFGTLNESALRIVYSGDTRPCRALVQAGRGADLVIHEATFEDELATHAHKKRHSTIDEAVTVSQNMQVCAEAAALLQQMSCHLDGRCFVVSLQARLCVLTHFSARGLVPRIPSLSPTTTDKDALEVARRRYSNVCMAFDGLAIKPSQYAHLPPPMVGVPHTSGNGRLPVLSQIYPVLEAIFHQQQQNPSRKRPVSHAI